MAKKDSFILYTEQKAVLDKLTDEQAGKLIKAIYEYTETGIMPELDSILDLVITPFKTVLDKDKAKYEEVSKARAEAGSKGGKQSKSKGTNGNKDKQKKQLQTNDSNCDVYDNEYEYDNDINKLNEFNLYNNFEQNLQCDCISKSTGKKCNRRSTYNINDKNYCNQHSRPIISRSLEKSDNKKKKYGENQNVFFTDEEYEKVKAYFPNDYEERIQSLDDYIQSTGKKYKDFFATLKTWARKEGYKPPNNPISQKEEFLEIDTSQLTEEEYGKLVRKEITIQELIEKGRIHV